MPLARYFMYVGGVLLALLFVVNAYLPAPPPIAERAETELPVIRIQSERKWPKPVVFDTSHPTNAPAQPVQIAKTDAAKTEAAAQPAPATVADVAAKARMHDAFAQLQPSDPKQAQQPDPKKPEAKPQPKRKIAKRRVGPHMGPPTMLVAQQPRFGFGFFGNNIW
jgi:hypothetical protein